MPYVSKEKQREYYKTYYEKNKEKVDARNKATRRKRHKEHWFGSIKSRCKKNSIPFDLDKEDLEIPEKCPILGMAFKRGIGRPEDTSPSVDRINPTLGYIKGNVQVISNLANKMKANATPEQLLLFADWVYKTYGAKDS